MSALPPPRYRIFERDRRLVVIDNWADKRASAMPPPAARPAMPRPTGSTPNRIVRAGDEGGALLRRLALIACGNKESAEGRPIFTTATWYDAKAPRSFTLGQAGVRRLGGVVLAGCILIAAFVVLVAVTGPVGFFVPFAFLAVASKNGKPAITRWIDGFERLPAD
jgi:hypothetical protein